MFKDTTCPELKTNFLIGRLLIKPFLHLSFIGSLLLIPMVNLIPFLSGVSGLKTWSFLMVILKPSGFVILRLITLSLSMCPVSSRYALLKVELSFLLMMILLKTNGKYLIKFISINIINYSVLLIFMLIQIKSLPGILIHSNI